MQFVQLQHLFLLSLVISCLIAVIWQTQELDRCIATWPQVSLPDLTKKVSMIHLYLARVCLELLDRGLDLRLMAFEQWWILLTVVERNVGKAQYRK